MRTPMTAAKPKRNAMTPPLDIDGSLRPTIPKPKITPKKTPIETTLEMGLRERLAL